MGNLSYPVYIIHALIVTFLVRINLDPKDDLKKIFALTLVVGVAYLTNKYLASPIEKIRQSRT